MSERRRAPSILDSFNYAFEGLVHVLRTQRNMRIHFLIAVGYLVFSGSVADRSSRFLDRLSNAPAELTLVALALTIALVIGLKALSGRGTPLRGGWPSGHAAVAFAGWMAVTLILEGSTHRFVVSSLAFIMAVLVAQTRVESGVHSALEVGAGATLGALVTLVVFQVFSA